jgi:uncharacterized membrane protein YgdD (TMEM256/DUF423 family)
MTERLIAALGAVLAAAGVALSAAAAHGGGAALAPAASMALLHGVALVALPAAAAAGLLAPRLARLSALAMGVGVALFSGDLALRSIAGAGLFPMAAPTGGTLLILGWLVAALAAGWAGGRRDGR